MDFSDCFFIGTSHEQIHLLRVEFVGCLSVYFKCFRILVYKLVLKRNLYAHFLSLHLSKSPGI